MARKSSYPQSSYLKISGNNILLPIINEDPTRTRGEAVSRTGGRSTEPSNGWAARRDLDRVEGLSGTGRNHREWLERYRGAFVRVLPDPVFRTLSFFRLLSSWPNISFSRFRRQFTDEGPGDFGGLAVVVVDDEMATKVFIAHDRLNDGCGGNLVGFPDGGVRFEISDPIVEGDIKGIFPLSVGD